MTLADARATIERNGSGWAEYIARSLDPDEVVREVDKTDGYHRWAPVGSRRAGILNHGADHRSQVCTDVTSLGREPPKFDVFDIGFDMGRIVEKLPDAWRCRHPAYHRHRPECLESRGQSTRMHRNGWDAGRRDCE